MPSLNKHIKLVGTNQPVEVYKNKNAELRIQLLIPEFININNLKIEEL